MNADNQSRRELLAALSRLSELRPEWRLGQTMANLATSAGRLDSGGVWDLEDDEALEAARTLIIECNAGAGATTPKDQQTPVRSDFHQDLVNPPVN